MNTIHHKIWNLIRGGSFHGYLRTANGYPLTLSGCMPEYPVSLTVAGNTVQDGTPSPETPVEIQGCGDRTANLFNPTVFSFSSSSGLNYELRSDGGIRVYGTKTKDGTWLAIQSSFELSGSYYTPRLSLVVNTANESTEITENRWGVLYTTDSISSTYVNPYGGTIKLSEGETLKSVQFYFTDKIATGTYVDITIYIMLNEGNTALPYEPYGYKVPVRASGKNLSPYEPYHEPEMITIYIDAPLHGNGDVSDAVELDIEKKTATLTRRYGVVSFDGSESWRDGGGSAETTTVRYMLRHNKYAVCDISHGFAASNYLKLVNTAYTAAAYVINAFTVTTTDFCVKFDGVKTLDEFKTWLSEQAVAGVPLTVVCQLAKPVTTDISDKIDWDSIPKLWRGTVIITADTTVQPSAITAKYYADKPEEVN